MALLINVSAFGNPSFTAFSAERPPMQAKATRRSLVNAANAGSGRDNCAKMLSSACLPPPLLAMATT
ncbi:hypothetical protein, partial [Xanthomonas campestris]|uniref:hypothetical protein n=1 Tax=Xanthomonas campestris TaxID=339 RepID=UPI0028835490